MYHNVIAKLTNARYAGTPQAKNQYLDAAITELRNLAVGMHRDHIVIVLRDGAIEEVQTDCFREPDVTVWDADKFEGMGEKLVAHAFSELTTHLEPTDRIKDAVIEAPEAEPLKVAKKKAPKKKTKGVPASADCPF